jgi:hypothetical protein
MQPNLLSAIILLVALGYNAQAATDVTSPSSSPTPLSGAGLSCTGWELDLNGDVGVVCLDSGGNAHFSSISLSACVLNQGGVLHCLAKFVFLSEALARP